MGLGIFGGIMSGVLIGGLLMTGTAWGQRAQSAESLCRAISPMLRSALRGNIKSTTALPLGIAHAAYVRDASTGKYQKVDAIITVSDGDTTAAGSLSDLEIFTP